MFVSFFYDSGDNTTPGSWGGVEPNTPAEHCLIRFAGGDRYFWADYLCDASGAVKPEYACEYELQQDSGK